MTYLNPFLRLVVLGTLYGVEDFSYSLNFIGGNILSAPLSVPPEVITEVQRYHSNNSAPVSSHAVLTTVKINLIGEDGRYVNDDTVLHDYTPGIPGGSSSNIAPQLALVISTATAAARGRAHAGRWYLPVPGGQPDASGVLSGAFQSSALAEAKTFVQNLEDALPGWTAGVVSNIGTGAERPITHLRVGKVIDTVRSRRDKFPEAYVEGQITRAARRDDA